MSIGVDSLAAAVGVGVKNVQFGIEALNLPRKILLIGQARYDISSPPIPFNEPYQIYSPEEVGSLMGRGSMIHMMSIQAFLSGEGIDMWIAPQSSETGTKSTGDMVFSGTVDESGFIHLYISNKYVRVAVTKGDTLDEVRDKVIAVTGIDEDFHAFGSTGGVATVTFTAKSTGLFWGDNITLNVNMKAGEELPSGLSVAYPALLSGGDQVPDISLVLDNLGTGDDANAMFFTDIAHGYGQDTTVLDAISDYVGPGNDFVGLYKKIVARPFRVLTGDRDEGTDALTALKALGNGRKLDRANGVIAIPGSASHPTDAACQAIGHMAKINNQRAAQNYIDIVLSGIDPGPNGSIGASSGRWTAEYDNRDQAVKAGISPTKYESGVLVLQNVVTFYHPDNVPLSSNAYLSMRNISIIQNIMNSNKSNFKREKWQGISIVDDVAEVIDLEDRKKARDIDSVKDDLMQLAILYAGKAWLFNSDFTINKLKEADAVVIRSGGIGFDNIFRVILSGEGLILDTITEIDINTAVAV